MKIKSINYITSKHAYIYLNICMAHHITRTSQSHTKKKTLAPTCLCAAGDPRPTGLLVNNDDAAP